MILKYVLIMKYNKLPINQVSFFYFLTLNIQTINTFY